MRCSEPGESVAVAIVASRTPGRWAWVVRPLHAMTHSDDIVTGGVCYGNVWPYTMRVKAPWASLIVSPEALLIEVDFVVARRSFSLSRSCISSLRRRRVLFWHGIQIHHTCDAPRSIIFFPSRPDIFEDRLHRVGYEIAA